MGPSSLKKLGDVSWVGTIWEVALLSGCRSEVLRCDRHLLRQGMESWEVLVPVWESVVTP